MNIGSILYLRDYNVHKFSVPDRNLLTGEGKLEFFSACINNFHIICIKQFHQETIGHKVEGV